MPDDHDTDEWEWSTCSSCGDESPLTPRLHGSDDQFIFHAVYRVDQLHPPVLQRQVTLDTFWGLNGWAGSATGTDDVVNGATRFWHIIGDDVMQWRRLQGPQDFATVPSGLLAASEYATHDGVVSVEWTAERRSLIDTTRAQEMALAALIREVLSPYPGLAHPGSRLSARFESTRRVRRMRGRADRVAFLNGNNGSATNTDDHVRMELVRQVQEVARFIVTELCRSKIGREVLRHVVGMYRKVQAASGDGFAPVLKLLRSLVGRAADAAIMVALVAAVEAVIGPSVSRGTMGVVVAPLVEELLPRVLIGPNMLLYKLFLSVTECVLATKGAIRVRIAAYWRTAVMHVVCAHESALSAVCLHAWWNLWANRAEQKPGALSLDDALREIERVRPLHVRELEAAIPLSAEDAHAQQARVRAQWRAGWSNGSTASDPGPRGGRGGRRKKKKRRRRAEGETQSERSASPVNTDGSVCVDTCVGTGCDVAPSVTADEGVVLRYYQRDSALGSFFESTAGAIACDPAEGDGALALELGYSRYTLHRIPVRVYEKYRQRVAAFKLADQTIRALHGTLQQLEEYQGLSLQQQEYVRSVLPAIVEQRIALQTLADSKAGGSRGVPSGTLNSNAPTHGTWGGFVCTTLRSLSCLVFQITGSSDPLIVQHEMPLPPDGSLLVTTGGRREPVRRGTALCLALCALMLVLFMRVTRRIWGRPFTGSSMIKWVSRNFIGVRRTLLGFVSFLIGLTVSQRPLTAYLHAHLGSGSSVVRRR